MDTRSSRRDDRATLRLCQPKAARIGRRQPQAGSGGPRARVGPIRSGGRNSDAAPRLANAAAKAMRATAATCGTTNPPTACHRQHSEWSWSARSPAGGGASPPGTGPASVLAGTARQSACSPRPTSWAMSADAGAGGVGSARRRHSANRQRATPSDDAAVERCCRSAIWPVDRWLNVDPARTAFASCENNQPDKSLPSHFAVNTELSRSPVRLHRVTTTPQPAAFEGLPHSDCRKANRDVAGAFEE